MDTKQFYCSTERKTILPSGSLANGAPRCGACNGCDQWLAESTCDCFSSWKLPGTRKHKVGFRVCYRCGLRRRPSHQKAMYRQSNEDNATILYMDENGILG